MARCGREVPNALLLAWIKLRVVGAGEIALRPRDFVLAAAFFAAVLVGVQDEPVVARTRVRADRVRADVLTSAVVRGTLVLIWIDNNTTYEISQTTEIHSFIQIQRFMGNEG